MDFSRRGFMNFLGLGGIALAAEATTHKVVAPLFGSDDQPPLVIPDADLTVGHFVVYEKGRIEKIPPSERKASKYGIPVARLTRNREPGGAALRMLPPRHHRITASARLDEHDDPHVAFYKASMEMREKFARYSTANLQQVPKEFRSLASLVTVVRAPIHAMPEGVCEVWNESIREYVFVNDNDAARDGFRGFHLACDFTQFVRVEGARKGVETFQQYSDKGEYPILPPKAVDMELMMRLDKEVVAERETSPDRVSMLLRRFRV